MINRVGQIDLIAGGDAMNDKPGPKYKRVYDTLRKRLQDGYYSVGTRLPTEDALATTFDVSRVTVRRSLDMLVSEGYLVARQGSGYLVDTLSPPSSTCLTSFTDSVLKEGREPGARLIDITFFDGDAPEAIGDMLGKSVVCIRRLRTVDGEPKMLVNTWLPTARVTGLSKEDFPETGQDQSILRVLSGRFGLEWSRACETIRSCVASDEIGAFLQVPVQTPLLVQACTAFDDEQGTVFFEEVFRNTPITFNLGGSRRQEQLS
ncbi:GntR family transcriptional regulator [Nitratireductor sp. CAU 1489]|uniref:GntR family transcriptional regulator n=2 Tax=Nitratireductor arenosus TaxID=2682096 RepID=A0A844Q9X4_9HYPH|nr:GntR family transcriptional regulator [Nitratireductor arenosus]